MSRVTINVNGLSLVHEDSGGVSTATLPDACLTPPTNEPVPYPNVAFSRDLAGGTSGVRADGGHRIAVAGSTFARSVGDEPGLGGGVTSGTRGAEASFLSHSFDVAFEGRPACRLTDKMLHNRGNTIDCGGVAQHHIGPARKVSAPSHGAKNGRSQKGKLPLWQTPLRPSRQGVDTNNRTLDTAYAQSRGVDFIGRYISGLSQKEANALIAAGKMTSISPNEIRLSHSEAETLGMDLVAIWEVNVPATTNVGPNTRALEAGAVEAQHHLGFEDGRKADKHLKEAGGGDAPIYFTVDFHVTGSVWGATLTDKKTGKQITNGDLIVAYFAGINHAIGIPRTGVYGTYTTVKHLFELEMVRYGWQMTFNHTPYHRAQIHQTSIYPDITRWSADPRKDPSAMPIYAAALLQYWGIQGAGGLDFDRALRADFGQWRPPKKPPTPSP